MSFLVVSLQYDVKPEYREPYLDAMRVVRENALTLGAVDYLLLEDDARSNRFTELLVYDNWLQYDRARTSAPNVQIEAIFEKLETWIEGGSNAAEVHFRKTVLGGWT